MEHYELRCLCDAFRNAAVLGNQLANTWWRPTPAAVFGELENDERGEIVFAEVWAPVTAAPVDEDLRKIIINLDGQEYGAYISLSGIQGVNMAPPKDRIWAGRLYSFGTPRSTNPLFNTTLKFKHDVTIAALCGPGTYVGPGGAVAAPITQNYRIRLWGYVYKTSELPTAFPGGIMQFPATLTETARRRSLVLSKNAIPINGDTWLTLPGGKDQSIPKINPFARYAYNLLATNALAGDFQFRFTILNVADAQEDMYFNFDDKDALFVEGLGIKADAAPGHLSRTGFSINGDYHPKGPTSPTSLFPTTPGINELNYGLLFPFAPITHPYFAAVPKLAQPYLIWNEIGYPLIRDDGLGAVGANTVVAALTGVRIEMRG